MSDIFISRVGFEQEWGRENIWSPVEEACLRRQAHETAGFVKQSASWRMQSAFNTTMRANVDNMLFGWYFIHSLFSTLYREVVMRELFSCLVKELKQEKLNNATSRAYLNLLIRKLEQMGWIRKRKNSLLEYLMGRLMFFKENKQIVVYSGYRDIAYSQDWHDTIYFEKGFPLFFMMSNRRWITVAGNYDSNGRLHIWFKENEDMWF